MPDHPLAALLTLPGVAEAVAEARAACTELRWHPGLRRGWQVARAEAGVRCAWAGLAMDGVAVPLTWVRAVAAGVGPQGAAGGAPGVADPAQLAVVGALRVQSAVVADWGPPGAPAARVPLGQLLARLHSAASPDAGAGRLRTTDAPGDLRGLGPAPTGAEVAGRLASLAALDLRPASSGVGQTPVPGLLVAAVLLGELLALRPFAASNGVVARAVFRRRLTADAVDPVGVVVPEIAWHANPAVHLSAAAGYATGTPEGVAAWLRHCADAVLAGAAEGRRVADDVGGAAG